MADYPLPDSSPKSNFDSMKHVYSIAAPKSYPELFRTHLDLASITFPRMYGFTQLQDSDSGTQKYLAGAGAEFYYLPPNGNGVPKLCTPFTGTVVLIRKNADGRCVISVPRSDPSSKMKSLDAPEHGGADPLDATHGKKFDLDPFSNEFAPDDEEDTGL